MVRLLRQNPMVGNHDVMIKRVERDALMSAVHQYKLVLLTADLFTVVNQGLDKCWLTLHDAKGRAHASRA
jgi:hypothetical protein